jgi:hypothetical protein
MMLFWSSLTLFLDSRRNDDPQFGDGNANVSFPSGRLTSTAWEGWWHDEA